MRQWSMRVVAGSVIAALGVIVLAAPGAGAAVKPVSVSHSQASILKHGFKARVANRGRREAKVKVRVQTRTFDDPDWTKAAKAKRISLKPRRHRSLHLKLTASGKVALADCSGRDVRVRVKKRGKRASLVRDTPACAPKPVDLSRADDCDFIGQQDGSLCMLPFPDDYYTATDGSSATGRRVAFKTSAMPANASGTHVDAQPYDLNDGFSPGQSIVLRVPGLDTPEALATTDPVQLNHLGRYSEDKAPVVVIDAQTGKRWPIWVELDSNAGSPDKTALTVNPAVNFASGHRYIVALRDLKDASGATIPAPEGFRYYRDDLPSDSPAIDGQRSRFDSIFDTLRDAGIRRSNLYMAWDFTVASDLNIAGRMLHIRNDAFATLGDTSMADMAVQGNAPPFNVTQVNDFTLVQNADVARRIRGTYTVPCYLFPDCGPGGRFHLDATGMPIRNGDYTQAKFDCIVPRSAVDPANPPQMRPSLYGHGLFGKADQVFGGYQPQLANQYGFVMCATDEIGMASEDVANTAGILGDLSDFPELADRLQEGLLTELFLGRLMITADGFSSNGAFHVDGTLATDPVIDTQRLFYDGNSQGGIMGGALAAVAPDFDRAALGVPAMRYSILLPRSVDYDEFAVLLNAAYTDPLERPLLLSMIQMLWDRGEPNGYANRMTTNPLPDTPAHTILLGPAVGDHQVTNWMTDVEARTIGAQAHDPIIDPGRWPDTDVLWNVPRATSYPFTGSYIAYNDFGPVRPDPGDLSQTIGTPPDPLTNTPNRVGEDPHGAPRGIPLGLQEVSNFLQVNGAVQNVCGASPCYAGGWTGL